MKKPGSPRRRRYKIEIRILDEWRHVDDASSYAEAVLAGRAACSRAVASEYRVVGNGRVLAHQRSAITFRWVVRDGITR